MANKKLLLLIEKIYNKKDITDIYNKDIQEMEAISPEEVFSAMNSLLNKGVKAHDILPIVDKVINVLYKNLLVHNWTTPERDTFLYYLIKENNRLKESLEELKPLIKKQDISETKKAVVVLIKNLEEYNIHLLKLENILFPEMEKKNEMFDGLSIMWALHDESRSLLKRVKLLLLDRELEISEINKIIGKLYFKYYGIIQKQDLLLFPAASKWITETEMKRMHTESFDFGFALINEPERPEDLYATNETITSNIFESKTGKLDFCQLEAVLNNLPFDITVIDADDRVAYFSDNNERIFPRTASVIGRKVQNCHPPKSLSMVEQILKSFKDNGKDTETFWINMQGKTILIKYSALRDESGRYLGTLEVTQDITEIKSIEGEKRLLDDRQ